MAIDPRALRQTMGQFATGVTVVALEAEGTIHAMTVNSFTSLSLDPPLVLFCAGKTSRAGQLVHGVATFCVNILQQRQRDLSTYFAGAWAPEAPPPFAFRTWHGAPLLEDSVAALACAVHAVHEGGDHWIVVGRVVDVELAAVPPPPLIFHGGRYVGLAPHGAGADGRQDGPEEPAAGVGREAGT